MENERFRLDCSANLFENQYLELAGGTRIQEFVREADLGLQEERRIACLAYSEIVWTSHLRAFCENINEPKSIDSPIILIKPVLHDETT